MPLDPGQLTSDLIGDYSSYLSSRFHFRHEGLRRQVAELLAADRRLHSGPFLELLPPFRPGVSVRQLVESGALDRGLLALPTSALQPDRALYRHQQRAIEKIQKDRNVVVATGPGSGKTETYVLPIVSHLLAQKASGRATQPRVRALLVYPMNALANDQLRRIRELLATCPEITFGRYTGETPKDRDAGLRRFRELASEAFVPEVKPATEVAAVVADEIRRQLTRIEGH